MPSPFNCMARSLSTRSLCRRVLLELLLRKTPRLLSSTRLYSANCLLHRLVEDAIGPEPPTAREYIAQEADIGGVHQGRPGHAALEDVVLEDVVVGIHVVEPVAYVMNVIAPHRRGSSRQTRSKCRPS